VYVHVIENALDCVYVRVIKNALDCVYVRVIENALDCVYVRMCEHASSLDTHGDKCLPARARVLVRSFHTCAFHTVV